MSATAGGRFDWSALAGRLIRASTIALIVLGPLLAVSTAVALGSGLPAEVVRLFFLIDMIYVGALAILLALRIGALFAARRQRSIGSRLHLRLASVFALVAFVPAVLLAVFATLTVNSGIESWFSDRVGSVLRNALVTAEAYEREHHVNLRGDVTAMAKDINRAMVGGVTKAQLNEMVVRQALVRELGEAYVFNLDREIVARGQESYLFNFEAPSDAHLARARQGEVVIIEDSAGNELRALVYLSNFFDSFLYVSRRVQGDVLSLLDETRETMRLYEHLERERGKILIDYALIYLGFAALVILAAVMLGFWFAERLARPVGRLAGAAERVGSGDLEIRVKEERGNDEIAILSRVFNRMTGQLKGQRDALIAARDETDRRRRFFEAVLSGVTAGVIGLDRSGQIDLVNEAALDLLGLSSDTAIGQPLGELAPGFVAMLETARDAPGGVARGEVRQHISGEPREFLARVAPKSAVDRGDGFVLTFDDMTALASAQRMAAWGDVARRIAHEIKNPLTPILLSADRMRRKFVGRLAEDGEGFERYLDVITRQTAEIRRMVDEFSKFARMPEPRLEALDLGDLIREAVLLQSEARPQIDYRFDLPGGGLPVDADRGLMSQCLTNLLQNASDAIELRLDRDGDAAPSPTVQIRLHRGTRSYRLTIEDNGIGLPVHGRDRLTDPYVTTRDKGTGLGLAIVKKIIEQHGGELVLGDAGAGSGLDGALVGLRLPRASQKAGVTGDVGENGQETQG